MKKKQSWGFGGVAIIILVAAMLFPLITPIASGKGAGKAHILNLLSLVKLESTENDYDYYYEDSEQSRYTYNDEKLYEKMKKDLKKKNSYGDNISIWEEIRLLSKYETYDDDLQTSKVATFNWNFALIILILALTLLTVLLAFVGIVLLVIYAIRGRLNIDRSQKCVRRVLYGLVPLIIIIAFQNSRVSYTYLYFSNSNLGSNYISTNLGVGVFLVLLLVIILTYVFISSVRSYFTQMIVGQIIQKSAIAKVLLVATVLLATISLAVNLQPNPVSISTNEDGKVGGACFSYWATVNNMDSMIEEEEEKIEKEKSEDSSDYYFSSTNKDIEEIEAIQKPFKTYAVAGTLIFIALLITLALLGSAINNILKKRKFNLVPVYAFINIGLYIASGVLIHSANDSLSRTVRKMEKDTEDVDRYSFENINLKYAVIVLLTINIVILILEVYRLFGTKKIVEATELVDEYQSNNILPENFQGSNASLVNFQNSNASPTNFQSNQAFSTEFRNGEISPTVPQNETLFPNEQDA